MKPNPYNHRVNIDPGLQAGSPNRLFLFADARSGSTWLVNTLNSHPEISMIDEILNPDFEKNFTATRNESMVANLKGNARFIESYLGHLGGKFAGCKILFPQAIRHLDFYEFLLNYRGARYLLLYRQNIVKAEISGMIANKHARWHLINHQEKQTIVVDPEFLFERLVWRSATREFCTSLIQKFCPDVFTIEYEDLFADQRNSLQKILAWLGLAEGTYSFGNEVKSNPFPLSELVENYDECKNAFKNHEEWYRMFSE